MRTVTLFTKPNCPLCDEALEQVQEAHKAAPFELVEVNILDDEAVYRRHQHHIPVVCLDGVELFRHRLTAAELLAKLRA
jgi:glutaredoxin